MTAMTVEVRAALQQAVQQSQVAEDEAMEVGLPFPAGQQQSVVLQQTTTARSSSNVEMVSHLTSSFRRGDLDMVRATHIKVLLGSNGAILKSNDGNKNTYDLSAPAEKIDYFVSHNWLTPRLSKFAALALQWNFAAAMVATIAALGVIFAMTAAGLLPRLQVTDTNKEGEKTSWEIGVTATMAGPWIFLITLFTWHEVGTRIGIMNEKVFLDKTCIHQANAEKKKQGIMSLAAFLERANGLVIVYSETYLRRLWTVFELASFLILFPEKKLKVVPVFFPKMMVVALLTAQAFEVLWTVVELTDSLGLGTIISDDVQLVHSCIILVQNTFFVLISVAWGVLDTMIRETVESFSLADAACSDPADRVLVRSSVELFMKRKGLVREGASQEEASKAFDQLVHKEVPRKLRITLGPVGIPYKYMVAIFLPVSCKLVDIAGMRFYRADDGQFGDAFGEVLATATFHWTVNLATYPLLMGMAALLVHKSLRVRRQLGPRRQALLAVLTAAALGGAIVAVMFVHRLMWEVVVVDFDMGSILDWLEGLAVALVCAVLVGTVYWWIPRRAP